jgi:hypothetical protein
MLQQSKDIMTQLAEKQRLLSKQDAEIAERQLALANLTKQMHHAQKVRQCSRPCFVPYYAESLPLLL